MKKKYVRGDNNCTILLYVNKLKGLGNLCKKILFFGYFIIFYVNISYILE